uniref:Trypsin inhibitor n=1 Tax=Veronica hederifolia TaxID=202477 RepID=TI_VERHE|nr:RecName: Full=Trypsin inhibitor; Short=VhTI [Veronica hederifolia]2CMY_B Chain B, VERONICA HEDERIFOLIA TRYPSIN INHIBITOR [Veronica hederifolia]
NTDPEQCKVMCYAQRHSSPELLRRCLDNCEKEHD